MGRMAPLLLLLAAVTGLGGGAAARPLPCYSSAVQRLLQQQLSTPALGMNACSSLADSTPRRTWWSFLQEAVEGMLGSTLPGSGTLHILPSKLISFGITHVADGSLCFP